MAPDNERLPPVGDPGRRPAGSRPPALLLLFALLLVLVVIGGYFVFKRVSDVEQQMAELAHQVSEAALAVGEAAERSEAALEGAIRAEGSARDAARGRDVAEKARTDAERSSERAQAEAESARHDARRAREEAERVRKEREEELDRLHRALSEIVETRRTAIGLVMNLGTDSIQFDFDKATLRPENRELLSRIAGILLSSKGYRIYVYGHTDDVGTTAYNIGLSELRARTVSDYLVEAGIDPDIVTTKGYGESSPRLAGTAPEAREMNRRVEIGIVDVTLDYAGEAPDRD